MKIDVIPDHPIPLTGEQAEAMEHRTLKKHHLAIILLHWFNAFIWLIELATGLALMASPDYHLAPDWYIPMVQGVFGSRGGMMRVHLALGSLWIGVFLAYGLFGHRTYLAREVLRREIGIDRDDLAWLRIRVLRILGRTREDLPPQGVYNAGQKLFALLVYAMLPLIMLSGAVMGLGLGGPAMVGWAVALHFCVVGAVVAGLIVHVYMGAVFPEEKPAFFSMITGSVNELFAYSHHFKWWREMKLEERTWEAAHDQAAARESHGRSEGEGPSAR